MRSLPLKQLAIAFLLACAVPALAQTTGSAAPAPPGGNSKQAENDCSGLTWVALDNCLKQNADNARVPSRPVDNNPRGATHDCSGMIGAPLETCLKMNGQPGTTRPSGNSETRTMEKS
jgi:hypothetical protein